MRGVLNYIKEVWNRDSSYQFSPGMTKEGIARSNIAKFWKHISEDHSIPNNIKLMEKVLEEIDKNNEEK